MSPTNPLQEYEKFKASAGGVFCPDYGTIKISGVDAREFLHRMTTQDVSHLPSGQGYPAALLQSNGSIVSLFDLYNAGPFFLVVAEKKVLQETYAYLEKFHFAEQLEIQDVTGDFKFLSVQFHAQGPSGSELQFQIPKSVHGITGTEDFFCVNEKDFNSGSGFHLLVKSAKGAECLKSLEQKGLPILSVGLWELLRAEAGFFSFGRDITDKNLILEAPVADGVHRNKGCYPGQEMVERVFTYGSLGKKLVGLRWPAGADPETLAGNSSSVTPLKLFAEQTEAGSTTSVHVFPWNHKIFGFAVVRKPHYEPGTKLRLGPGSVEVEVSSLPHQFEIRRELD